VAKFLSIKELLAELGAQEFPVALNFTYIDWCSVGEGRQAPLLLNVSTLSFLRLLARFVFVKGVPVVQHATLYF